MPRVLIAGFMMAAVGAMVVTYFGQFPSAVITAPREFLGGFGELLASHWKMRVSFIWGGAIFVCVWLSIHSDPGTFRRNFWIYASWFFVLMLSLQHKMYLVALGLSVPLFMLAIRLCKGDDQRVDSKQLEDSIWVPVCLMFGITIFSRFYLLDVLPSYWDEETATNFAMASSLTFAVGNSLQAILPTPTGGPIWHVLLSVAHSVFDISILSQRLMSALIGCFSVLVFYLLARKFVSPGVSVVGAAIFSMSTLELGWSRLPNFHHMPGLFILLLLCAAARASTNPSLGSLIFLSISMGLTNLLYPSGLVGFLVPIPLLMLQSFSEHSAYRFRIWASLGFGVLLWVFARTLLWFVFVGEVHWVLPWFSQDQGIIERSVSLSDFIRNVLQGIVQGPFELLRAIFATPESPRHHWSPLWVTLPPLTYIPKLTFFFVVFGLVSLLRRPGTKASLLLLFALPILAVPSIFSTEIEARRAGPLFAVCGIVALIGIERVISHLKEFSRLFYSAKWVGIFITGYSLLSLSLFLRQPIGVPPQNKAMEVLLPQLVTQEPLLVVSAIRSPSYRKAAIFTLAVDAISEQPQPIGWSNVELPDEILLPETFHSPRFDGWEMNSTKLRRKLDKVREVKCWNSVLVLADFAHIEIVQQNLDRRFGTPPFRIEKFEYRSDTKEENDLFVFRISELCTAPN